MNDNYRQARVVLMERQTAALEALKLFHNVTEERGRARIVARPAGAGLGAEIDVTEDVVSILDRLTETLDWGSGFFTDEDLIAFFRLVDLLKIDVPPSVERPAALAEPPEDA